MRPRLPANGRNQELTTIEPGFNWRLARIALGKRVANLKLVQPDSMRIAGSTSFKFVTMLVALLADLINFNRRLIESTLQKIRALEYERSSVARTGSGDPAKPRNGAANLSRPESNLDNPGIGKR